MTSRPRLNDVARLAEVSVATVSRVLNGKHGVATQTRERVLAVLGDLGYRDVAVRPSTNGVIGIITPELDNPIFPLMAQAIEARLAREGLLTMICSATSATVNEQEYLDHFLASGSAGLVIINGRYAAPDVGYAPYTGLLETMPTVLVNGVGLDCPLPAVSVDIVAGASMAIRYLASLGHRRIGCLVGPRRYTSTIQLIEGFHQGMDQCRLAVEEEVISETMFTLEGGRAGAVKLIEAGVTAVVTAGDLMALGAVAGLRSWDRSVPGQVSVVGFDGTSLVNYTDPSLTSIRQPVERMAQAVALLLHARSQTDARVHMFEPDLVIGASTGPAP